MKPARFSMSLQGRFFHVIRITLEKGSKPKSALDLGASVYKSVRTLTVVGDAI